MPNASSAAVAPRGTRHVASYSCMISGPVRGADSAARSTTGVSIQPASGNHARRLRGHVRRGRRDALRQPRPFRRAARDDRQPDQLHRLVIRRAKTVGPLMLRREQRRQAREQCVAASCDIRQRHLDLARLADIASRRGTTKTLPRRRKAVARQRLRAGLRQRREHAARSAPHRHRSSRVRRLCVAWCSASAISSPKALNSPGIGGTITRAMPSSAAIPAANSGPLPPNASSANCRGSRPRSTDTARIARIIVAEASRSMPNAASSTEQCRGVRQVAQRSPRAPPRHPLSARRRPGRPGRDIRTRDCNP